MLYIIENSAGELWDKAAEAFVEVNSVKEVQALAVEYVKPSLWSQAGLSIWELDRYLQVVGSDLESMNQPPYAPSELERNYWLPSTKR